MANQSSSAMTGKPLIESDRVEGTTVYDPSGAKIGSIKRLMIDKLSGKVAYSVMSFGGFLGIGEETDITEQQLKGAPLVLSRKRLQLER